MGAALAEVFAESRHISVDKTRATWKRHVLGIDDLRFCEGLHDDRITRIVISNLGLELMLRETPIVPYWPRSDTRDCRPIRPVHAFAKQQATRPMTKTPAERCIKFSATPDEHALIRVAAALSRTSISAFVRREVLTKATSIAAAQAPQLTMTANKETSR